MNKSSKTPRLLFFISSLLTAVVMNAQSRKTVEVAASYFVGAADQVSYGPSALRIAPDGTFWIVNPADNTLTNVDKEGWLRRQFRLDEATGITDVQFSEDGDITALDGAAEPPALLSVTANGTVRDRRELRASPLSVGHSSVSTQDEELKPLASSALSLEWTGLSTFDRWRILPGTDMARAGLLTSDSSRIEVKATRGVIRGLRILSDNAKGLFVLVEEVADHDPITVDATVRLYARSGELLGIGRVPLTAQYTYVENPVAVSDDGEVYLLTTKPGRVAISVLPLERSIPDILPEPREPARQEHPMAAGYTSQATPSITRSQIETNARVFLNNSTYYNQSALTGSCPGRTAPRYLGTTPRFIGSVAYDWGGFDSVADYNSFIAAGQRAGDIDSHAVESCSHGQDCSGYVSRVWGLGVKKSTCSLADVSWVISLASLMKGDILTKCGDHVVLFDTVSGGGILAYESTTYNALDRVVYLYSSWSRLNGYTPRRYNNVAVDSTTPAHVSSNSSPSSGAPGMTATFSSTWRNVDATPMSARLTLRMPWGSTYDYTMGFISGQTATGALFQTRLVLPSVGRYDYAVTVTSLTTGRRARYPESGFVPGPSVVTTSYSVTPLSPVCGQYPVAIRVNAYVFSATVVRFSVTKGNNYCGRNGNFLANGIVDLRLDSPYGPVVASTWYSAGAPQVNLDLAQNFGWGSRRYFATIRNQGYWAGAITVTAR